VQIKQQISFSFADDDLTEGYKATGFFPAPTFEFKCSAFKARAIRNLAPLFAFRQCLQTLEFYLDKVLRAFSSRKSSSSPWKKALSARTAIDHTRLARRAKHSFINSTQPLAE